MEPLVSDADELRVRTRALRALARGLVYDAATAEDVVQDALVTAMSRSPKPSFSIGGWLRGITRNHIRYRQRRERRREVRERLAATPESQEPADSVERLDLLEHLIGPGARTRQAISLGSALALL